MGIKRNKLAEPQWEDWEYAKIDKDNLFSYDLWKRTINWNLLLEHIKKTEGACQLINEYMYPSRLFTACIDILEANMCILDDIFCYETGIPPKADTKETWFVFVTHYLRFWNMDWYKEMKMIYDGLHRIENHLIKCLKQKPLSDIADEAFKKIHYASAFQDFLREPSDDIFHNCAYSYACEAYRDSETDKNTLVDQIVNIVNTIENYKMVLDYFININESAFSLLNFEYLVKMFRQSGKGNDFIRPWRRDFGGSRDSLIVKMEKDPELGPWVNRYTHLREGYNEKTTVQLFCDDDYNIKNIEETFNTDNWIRLLTIAAVLQEYDEHQAVTTAASAKEEETLLRLSLYIKENQAGKFLESAHKMTTDKEIIALVSHYYENHLIAGASIDLWTVLHDAKLYTKTYNNWRDQLNKSIKKEKKKTEKLD